MQAGRLFFIAGLILMMAVATGCAYTKKEVITVPCTIEDSTFYTRDVVPILKGNCYSCHSTASLSSGIALDNYAALTIYAKNGFLYGTISHASGYRPMPDNGGKLSDCDIAIIKNWIDKGTPQ